MLEAVFELADVAWPVVGGEAGEGFFADLCMGKRGVFEVDALEEVLDEEGDVAFAFSE